MPRLVMMVNLMQVFYIAMNAMGKLLMTKEGGVDLFEFTLARSFVLTVFSLIILLYNKRPFYVAKDMRTFMSIRTIAGTLTFLGACVGMKNLPVSWFVLIT